MAVPRPSGTSTLMFAFISLLLSLQKLRTPYRANGRLRRAAHLANLRATSAAFASLSRPCSSIHIDAIGLKSPFSFQSVS